MGKPKALLHVGDKTFFQHIVDVLASAGVSDVVAVFGDRAEAIQKHENWFGGRIVINQNWQDGQLSSLVAGLRALDRSNTTGVLLCPVDRPFLNRALILDMLQLFSTSGKPIVVPIHGGRRGHPLLFSSSLIDEFAQMSGTVGARALLRNHPLDIIECPADDSGCLLNIDTPEDYDRYSTQAEVRNS